ncbi:MAG: hypothetical protein ACRC8S_16035 [Fimbriiglobus sp.]
MKSMLLTISAMFLFSATMVAQSPSVRPTEPPQGVARQSDDVKSLPRTVLVPTTKGDDAKPVFAPVIEYKIGIDGYTGSRGFVVLATRSLYDFSRDTTVSPAANVRMKNANGTFTRGMLEPGDEILVINGYRTKSANEVIAAIQSSPNKTNIKMIVRDFRTGNAIEVYITAAQVEPNT